MQINAWCKVCRCNPLLNRLYANLYSTTVNKMKEKCITCSLNNAKFFLMNYSDNKDVPHFPSKKTQECHL